MRLFVLALVALTPALVLAQTNTGELRISIVDSAGLPVEAAVKLVSQANEYDRIFEATRSGQVVAKRLPFGLFQLQVTGQGFAAVSRLVEIRSAIPTHVKVTLAVAAVETSVEVTENQTLIDPHRTNSAYRVGGDALRDRPASRPGNSVADLVSTEPGWVFEANGILHPRSSEYQTQFVVDGVPLTDNRSLAFTPDFDLNNVQEMNVMTAGYPAEFGRKLGGVVEVETARDTRQGFHGKAEASGGSFDTAGGYLEGQYGWDANSLTISGAASTTDRYLDPPALENFTNHGTLEDFTAHYERDIDPNNRVGVILRREQSKFLIPNEIVQQAAGQREDRDNDETALEFSYQHIFSANVLGNVRAMARDLTAGFWSNPLSTPILAGQDRSYREGYVNAGLSVHHASHELKFGSEGDFASIREAFHYQITDPSQFDPGTPQTFNFLGRAQDREQSAFAQDLFRYKNWTFSGGIRFDHYGLLVHQAAWSPRTGVAYYWPAADVVFRFSYDRVFQTPAFENLLVSSSPLVTSLSDKVLRLPVKPSFGNYFEAGFDKAILGKVRINANLYHRSVSNYADDDLLLNTGISFPIAFTRAVIYGEEVKVEVPRWGPVSGFISYANSRGNGFLPVTGGLFLGDNAAQAITQTTGVFPVTQDQRNTVRTRWRYQISSRVWAALGGTYNSGLPVQFTGTYEEALSEYGPQIVNRVNFSDGRARPGFTLDGSVGADLLKKENQIVRLQVDGLNITNQLNVIDFAGLFSGTALAPTRSVNARLRFDF
jgi:outer membrane cobalamin receptor